MIVALCFYQYKNNVTGTALLHFLKELIWYGRTARTGDLQFNTLLARSQNLVSCPVLNVGCMIITFFWPIFMRVSIVEKAHPHCGIYYTFHSILQFIKVKKQVNTNKIDYITYIIFLCYCTYITIQKFGVC